MVILTTKQTANATVLEHLKYFLHQDSVVCTLQNGIPEEAVASYVGWARTVGGGAKMIPNLMDVRWTRLFDE